MNRELKFLILLILFTFLIRIIFLDTSYFFWDETIYLMHGKSFVGEQVGYEEINIRPPLLPLMLSLVWNFFPKYYEILSRILICILNSLVIIPVYYIGCIFNKKVGYLAAIIIAGLPVSILNSRLILTDHIGAILALTAFLFFFLGVRYMTYKWLYLGSFILVLSVVMKFTNIFLFFILSPLFLILLLKKPKQLFLSGLLFLIGMAPFLLYNYIIFNNPLYIFIAAFKVVENKIPIVLSFILYLFYDTFGLIFLFLAIIGIYLFLKRIILRRYNKEAVTFDLIFLFSFISSIILFVYILNLDVAKIETIKWEVERYMLFSVLFISIFIAYGLNGLVKSLKRGRIAFFVVIIILGFSLLYHPYIRAYTPQITFENGLRETTKEMGLFLKDSDILNISCIGNCPPIAYYSNKKSYIFYDINALFNSNICYFVIFDKVLDKEKYATIKEFCNNKHCVYLYKDLFSSYC